MTQGGEPWACAIAWESRGATPGGEAILLSVGDATLALVRRDASDLPLRARSGAEEAWLLLEGRLAWEQGSASGPALLRWPASLAPLPVDVAPVGTGATVIVFRAASHAGAPPAAEAPHMPEVTDLDLAPGAGNRFVPLLETSGIAAGLLALAPGRRVDSGPESARVFVPLKGTGLVFLENETTIPLRPGAGAFVPAGEPARVWARGPDELVWIALQPAGAPSGKRNLVSEVARLREAMQRARRDSP